MNNDNKKIPQKDRFQFLQTKLSYKQISPQSNVQIKSTNQFQNFTAKSQNLRADKIKITK